MAGPGMSPRRTATSAGDRRCRPGFPDRRRGAGWTLRSCGTEILTQGRPRVVEDEVDLLSKAVDQHRQRTAIRRHLLPRGNGHFQLVFRSERTLLEIDRLVVTSRNRKRTALDVGGVEVGIEEVRTKLVSLAVQHTTIVLKKSNPNENGVQVV